MVQCVIGVMYVEGCINAFIRDRSIDVIITSL